MTEPSDLMRRAAELTECADHEEDWTPANDFCEWRNITCISPRVKSSWRLIPRRFLTDVLTPIALRHSRRSNWRLERRCFT
jgi:hypothetical protein